MVWTDNEDRKTKQVYLRTEVVEKGYDPEKFAEYLDLKKNQGSNIDNWSLPE